MFVAPRPYFVPPKLDDPTLICHYLDTSVHSTGNDSSGNGHTGAITLMSEWGYGGRATFHNDTSRFRVADHADLRITDNLTVRFWLKAGTTSDVLMSRYDGGLDDRSWKGSLGGSGNLSLLVSDDGTLDAGHYKSYQSTEVINDDVWHPAGFTFATGTLKMFIDGVEVTPTKTNDDAIVAIHAGTADLMLGADLNTDTPSGTCLSGSLACCGMWSEVKAESWFAEDYARR